MARTGPICLWISGDIGTGKTTLLSAIIEDLLQRQEEGCLTVYCFSGEVSGRDDIARHLLKVFIYLLHVNHVLPDFVLDAQFLQMEDDPSAISRESFQQALRALFRSVDHQFRITMVLDALDEDDWVNTVVLDEIVRANSSRNVSDLIRCVVSSRKSCHRNMHNGHVSNISLNNEPGVQRDVLLFAESRLADIFRTAITSSVTSLAKRICLQGQGIFLWVALAIENLHQDESFAEMIRKVESLPRTVDGLYREALDNIPSQSTRILRKLFLCLLAARRPLQLCELLEVLAVDGEIAYRIPNIQAMENEILQNCGPLISIARGKTMRFRHRSVKTHLLFANESRSWTMSMIEAHQSLAETCFTLLTPRNNEDSFSLQSKSTLKEYALIHWAFHYEMVEPHSRILVGTLYQYLMASLHHDCQLFALPQLGWRFRMATTTLRIAAFHGFVSLTQVALEMGVNPDGDECDSCASPLVLAAAGGHSKLVALLLQRGASTTADSRGNGQTALFLAAARGSEETVNILLNKDAKANSDVGILHRTPLHAAAASGHLGVTKILIEHELDPNAVIPTSGEGPLHLAASRGHWKVVKWLLEGPKASKEEMELYDSISQQRYFQAWVDVLLAECESKRRAFWEIDITCRARQEIRKLQSLCRKFADINLRTREGRTALHLAAINGHEPTVRVLLLKGAEVDIYDKKGRTALRLAAENGHLNVVRLLLGRGANLSLEYHQLGAILKSASMNGHSAVANLLPWHYLTREALGKPCQWPMLSLATKSRANVVEDAIHKRNTYMHDLTWSTQSRKRTSSQMNHDIY